MHEVAYNAIRSLPLVEFGISCLLKQFTAFIAVYIDSCVSFETERVDGWKE
jgi:hypothetical protein